MRLQYMENGIVKHSIGHTTPIEKQIPEGYYLGYRTIRYWDGKKTAERQIPAVLAIKNKGHL